MGQLTGHNDYQREQCHGYRTPTHCGGYGMQTAGVRVIDQAKRGCDSKKQPQPQRCRNEKPCQE